MMVEFEDHSPESQERLLCCLKGLPMPKGRPEWGAILVCALGLSCCVFLLLAR